MAFYDILRFMACHFLIIAKLVMLGVDNWKKPNISKLIGAKLKKFVKSWGRFFWIEKFQFQIFQKFPKGKFFLERNFFLKKYWQTAGGVVFLIQAGKTALLLYLFIIYNIKYHKIMYKYKPPWVSLLRVVFCFVIRPNSLYLHLQYRSVQEGSLQSLPVSAEPSYLH